MCVWTRQLLVLCGVFGLGAAFHGGALAQEEPPPTPIARYSGPFVIGGGVVDGVAIPPKRCGTMNMYKVSGEGRKWKLDGPCEELLRAMATPSPSPSPSPTPSPSPSPSPTPTRGLTDCSDGMFTPYGKTQLNLLDVSLSLNETQFFCFDLPGATLKTFEVDTTNQSNASCGVLKMELISPQTKTVYAPTGVQPGSFPKWEEGRWEVHLTLIQDCFSKFDVRVRW